MASQKIVLEFVGDASKLKPVTDALKGIKGLTSEQAQEFNKTNEAAKKVGKTIDETKAKQKGVADETTRTTRTVDDLGKRARTIPQEFDKARKSMNGAKLGADGLLGSVKRIGGALLAAFGVTSGIFLFVKFIRSFIDVNKDFELQMAKVKAITGATDKEFKQLSANAKKLGASTKYTATEVGQLSEEYAKLGFTTKEIIAASEATLLLAEATGSSLADAANVAGAVLRGFGLEADETARVTDVMALSFSKSALNLENFSEAMKYVAPIAKAANIDIETTTALLGKLADAGLRGSIAGTGLKNLLSKLSDGSSDLSKELGFSVKNSDDLFRAFQKLKEGNIDLTKATELTDERSKAAFLTLIAGATTAEELAEALRHATGATKEMAEIMRDTLQGDLDKLGASWEALMLSLGKTDGVRKAVQALSWWLDKTKMMLATARQIQDEDIELNREVAKSEADYFEQSINAMRTSIEKLSPMPELGIYAAIDKVNEQIEYSIKKLEEYRTKAVKQSQFVGKDGSRTKELQETLIQIAKLEVKLEAARDLYYKLKDEAAKIKLGGGKDGGQVIAAINSIENLNTKLKTLKETYETAEIGSKSWIKALGDITLATVKLERANKLAKDEVLKFKAANNLLEPDAMVETFAYMEKEFTEHEKRVRTQQEKAINDRHAREVIEATLMLDNSEQRGYALEIIELEHLKRLREYKIGWGESVNDIDIQIAESQAKIWDEQEEKYQRFLAGMEADAKASASVLTEMQVQQFHEVLQGADALYSGMTNLHRIQLDNQQRNLDNQLNSGLISQELYDQKKRELARKQAIADKNAALFKAIINVAAAVATALGGGPILGQVLAGITAALGAAEIGLIASTPIPAFAKGTKEAPKGFKWVGEKGAELIYDDGGYPIITNRESKVLADNPYSKEARTIMKKYDIPQLHTGLFGNDKNFNHEFIDMANGKRTTDIDYEKLARTLAKHLESGDVVNAIRSHQKSDAHGVMILATELNKAMRQPKRGNYA